MGGEGGGGRWFKGEKEDDEVALDLKRGRRWRWRSGGWFEIWKGFLGARFPDESHI